MVDFVLKQPVDPNYKDASGNTALHLAGTTATGHEYLKVVSTLLNHGAVCFVAGVCFVCIDGECAWGVRTALAIAQHMLYCTRL